MLLRHSHTRRRLGRGVLVHRVPAWSRNLTARAIRRPKIYMADSGMAAGLVGKDSRALQRPTDPAAGPLFETFIVNELRRQSAWSESTVRMFHFRDRGGAAVDVILEAADGRVVAVEIKSTSTPRPEDFRWLELLRDRLDRRAGSSWLVSCCTRDHVGCRSATGSSPFRPPMWT